MFPPDDQNLRPEQFARKVRSYVRTISPRERRVLLEFLVVQYDAFQKQLDLLFANASVSEPEYRERAERLTRYLDSLHSLRRSLDHGPRRDHEDYLGGFEPDSAAASFDADAYRTRPRPGQMSADG
jgi:hypothetical protein